MRTLAASSFTFFSIDNLSSTCWLIESNCFKRSLIEEGEPSSGLEIPSGRVSTAAAIELSSAWTSCSLPVLSSMQVSSWLPSKLSCRDSGSKKPKCRAWIYFSAWQEFERETQLSNISHREFKHSICQSKERRLPWRSEKRRRKSHCDAHVRRTAPIYISILAYRRDVANWRPLTLNINHLFQKRVHDPIQHRRHLPIFAYFPNGDLLSSSARGPRAWNSAACSKSGSC